MSLTTYDLIDTFSTVEKGCDGLWWWEASILPAASVRNWTFPAIHAGPCMGYRTQEAATQAKDAWIRSQVEGA